MRRREFIALVGGAVTWPVLAVAQSKDLPAVGFVNLGSEAIAKPYAEALRSGLVALGYTEGKNITLYYRFAEGNVERLSEFASELVSLGVKIIVTSSNTSIRAMTKAAPTVPIVSWASGDPIVMGWAQSLAKPGGMVTGLSIMGGDMFIKYLELLREVRPEATRFAALFNPTNPGTSSWKVQMQNAGAQLCVKVHVLEAKANSEFADTFQHIESIGAGGLLIIEDPVFNSNLPAISELALRHRLATVSAHQALPAAGGLVAYAFNYTAMARRSAWYVDRILKGEAPSDLPIEQPTEFKVIVNLKTAKALGLTIPPSLRARADEVIQ